MAFPGRTLSKVLSWMRLPVLMAGEWTGAGAADMTVTTFKGGGTATHNGTGDYSITIPGAPDVYFINVSLSSPDGALTDAWHAVWSYNSTTGVLTIHTSNNADPAALANVATDQTLAVFILAKGSSVSTGQ